MKIWKCFCLVNHSSRLTSVEPNCGVSAFGISPILCISNHLIAQLLIIFPIYSSFPNFPSSPKVPPRHTLCYLVSLNWQDKLASCLQPRKPLTLTCTQPKLLMASRSPSLSKNLGLAPFTRLSGLSLSSSDEALLDQNRTDNLSPCTAYPIKPTKSI